MKRITFLNCLKSNILVFFFFLFLDLLSSPFIQQSIYLQSIKYQALYKLCENNANKTDTAAAFTIL